MEIRIKRSLTGRARRDRILAAYYDLAALESAARQDAEAADDLWFLDLIKDDPSRLDETFTLEDVFELESGDLSPLTPTRLRILDALRRLGESDLNGLTAALHRDRKNVSEDVRLLESMGLVASRRDGKHKRIRIQGDRILIQV